MVNSVVIRNYKPVDRDSCRNLWRELTEWHRHLYQDPTIGGTSPENYFDEHLTKVGANNLWVATIDSQVVGFVGLIVKEGEEAEIEPLIVSQHQRHKGIGERLVEIAISEARRLNVKFLSVKPVARNHEVIRFFYKQGFKNVGHLQLFIDFSNKKWKRGLKLFDYEFNF